MIGPQEEGGLDIPDCDSIRKSLLVAWIRRMIDGVDDAWMVISCYSFLLLEQSGRIFFLKSNYDINLLDLEGLPAGLPYKYP